MRRHRILATLVVALAAIAVGIAPMALSASSAHAAAVSKPKTLVIATNGTVDSLSPFLALNVLPTEVHRLIYDFLTNYDPKDDHPIGGMAASWSTSPDKLTWTYHIRSGLAWSDGVAATADDIAWTYNLMMTNSAAATANGNFVANFSSVTAPNAATLVIQLKKPQATMLALDIPIVPEHIWKAHVKDLANFNNDTSFPIVSNGPFVLSSYKPNQFLVLTANKHYWRGAPKFDQVIFKYYKNGDAEVAALRKGEVDLVSGLTPAQFQSLKPDKNITLNDSPGKNFYALAINPGATTTTGKSFGDGNPALKDPLVRDAIMYAIDKQALISKTLSGYGKLGAGYLPPIFPANHWAPPPAQAVNYDPAKANQLLDQAGYKRGPGGMRVTPDGKPFTLRLLGETERDADSQNVTYVQEWLAAVGIKVTPSIVAQSNVTSVTSAGNYDMFFDSWLVNPDPDYILSVQTCADRPAGLGQPVSGDDFICDRTYDQLYQAQQAEYDPVSRSAVIKQMQQQLYKDEYVNVLYYPDTLEAYRSDVIASMDKQPQPAGLFYGQDGYWSFWSATPVTAAASSSNSGLMIGVVVAIVVVVVIGGGALIAMRRRQSTAQERE